MTKQFSFFGHFFSCLFFLGERKGEHDVLICDEVTGLDHGVVFLISHFIIMN